MIQQRTFWSVVAFGLILSAPASADEPSFESEQWFYRRTVDYLSVGPIQTERLASASEDAFFDSVADASGVVTAQSRQPVVRIHEAKRRSEFLKDYFQYDLNGDGQISRVEIEAVWMHREISFRGTFVPSDYLTQEVQEKTTREVDILMAPDTNHDGVLTISELVEAAREAIKIPVSPAHGNKREAYWTPVPAALSSKGDGEVTLDDYRRFAAMMAARIDKNHDGEISFEEVAAFARRMGDGDRIDALERSLEKMRKR